MDELEKTPAVADEIETSTFDDRAARIAEANRPVSPWKFPKAEEYLREVKRRESARRRERDRNRPPRPPKVSGDCVCGATSVEHPGRLNGKRGGCARTGCPSYFERGT